MAFRGLSGPRAEWVIDADLSRGEYEEGLSRLDVDGKVQAINTISRKGAAYVSTSGLVHTLAGLVNDPSPQVAAAAMEALAAMPSVSVPHTHKISAQLMSEDSLVKNAALLALEEFGREATPYVSAIEEQLKSNDAKVRASAIMALAKVAGESKAPTIADFLDDASYEVVAAACQALGSLEAGKAHMSKIEAKLGNDQTRCSALIAIRDLGGGVGDNGTEKVLEICSGSDPVARELAAEVLGKIGDKILANQTHSAKLASMLESQDAGIRCSAAEAFGLMGSKAAPQYRSKVAELLHDSEEDTSWYSLQLGGGHRRAYFDQRRPKCAALVALARMGCDDYAETCVKWLSDPAFDVRFSALIAAEILGQPAGQRCLQSALEDSTYAIRAKACQLVKSWQADNYLEAVVKLIDDNAMTVRIHALEAIAEVSEFAGEFAEDVAKRLSVDVCLPVKAAAIRALGGMGESAYSYAGIIAGLLVNKDSDSGIRHAALEALGKMAEYGAAFAEEVATFLDSGNPDLRAAAAQALSNFGDEGKPFLTKLRALEGDQIGVVSKAAREALQLLDKA